MKMSTVGCVVNLSLFFITVSGHPLHILSSLDQERGLAIENMKVSLSSSLQKDLKNMKVNLS